MEDEPGTTDVLCDDPVGEADTPPLPSKESKFALTLMRKWAEFVEIQLAIIDLLPELAPILPSLAQRSLDDEFLFTLRMTQLEAEERRQMDALFEDGIGRLRSTSELIKHRNERTGFILSEIEKRKAGRELKDVPEDEADEIMQLLAEAQAVHSEELPADPEHPLDLVKSALSSRRDITTQDRLLAHSLLVSSVAAFESLILDLITQFLEAFPGARGETSMKELSLDDLREIGDVQDAITLVAARHAEAVLRGPEEDWDEWFSSPRRYGFKLSEIPCWDLVCLAIQRRHIVVHNRGLASKLYCHKTKDRAVAVGSEVPIDFSYVANAAETLLAAGSIIVARSIRRVEKTRGGNFAIVLVDAAFELMRRQRWVAAQQLYGLLSNPGVLTEDATINIVRVNGWLCKKRLEGLQAIEEDVRKWDVSALHERYALARLALLDSLDEAFPLLRRLVHRKQITADEIANWPLLRELRSDARASEFFAPPDEYEGGSDPAD